MMEEFVINNERNFEPTEKEKFWIENLLKGEEALTSDYGNRKDTWIDNGYLDYLDLMIKCGNLRAPSDEDEYKEMYRLIKVNKRIAPEYLKGGRYQYTVFNGLYVVNPVMFVKAENCKSLLKRRLNDNPKISDEKVIIPSIKQMCFEDGSKWCVFLCRSHFTDMFMGYLNSEWTFPYIYDEED